MPVPTEETACAQDSGRVHPQAGRARNFCLTLGGTVATIKFPSIQQCQSRVVLMTTFVYYRRNCTYQPRGGNDAALGTPPHPLESGIAATHQSRSTPRWEIYSADHHCED